MIIFKCFLQNVSVQKVSGFGLTYTHALSDSAIDILNDEHYSFVVRIFLKKRPLAAKVRAQNIKH